MSFSLTNLCHLLALLPPVLAWQQFYGSTRTGNPLGLHPSSQPCPQPHSPPPRAEIPLPTIIITPLPSFSVALLFFPQSSSPQKKKKSSGEIQLSTYSFATSDQLEKVGGKKKTSRQIISKFIPTNHTWALRPAQPLCTFPMSFLSHFLIQSFSPFLKL